MHSDALNGFHALRAPTSYTSVMPLQKFANSKCSTANF